MNKVYKIIFNASRGMMMVANEATSSIQTGKTKAIVVAVASTLVSGAALAASEKFSTNGNEYTNGGKIIVSAMQNGQLDYQKDTSTVTITAENNLITSQSNGYLIFASLASDAAVSHIGPTVNIVGNNQTEVNLSTTLDYGIVSRQGAVVFGSDKDHLKSVTLKSQDALFYLTASNYNDHHHDLKQKTEIYADTVDLQVESADKNAIIGNGGSIKVVADSRLNIVGKISGYNSVYGGVDGMDYDINYSSGAKAYTTIVGDVESSGTSVVRIGLRGEGSSLTGNISAIGHDDNIKTGGDIAVAFGDNGQLNGDVIAQTEGTVDLNFGKNGVMNGHIEVDNGRVDVDGDLTINAEKDAIVVGENAIVNINKDSQKGVVLNGDIKYVLQSGSTASGDVNLNLNTASSVWNGNFIAYWSLDESSDAEASAESFKNAKLNLTLSNGAQWNPTAVEKDSISGHQGSTVQAINSINLDEGVINLKDGVQADVTSMTGNGTVNIGTTEGKTSASLNVDSMKEDVSINVGIMNSDLSEKLTADQISVDQAKDIMSQIKGDKFETSTEVPEGMYNDGFGIAEDGSSNTLGPNSLMQSTLELATVAPLALNRILTNDVHKRMGDIRSMNATSGAWARYDGGSLSSQSGLDNDFHTIQVGVDTVPTPDAPRFGVAFSYTKSDADYKRGSADMDVYSLAAYGLWMNDKGQFVDVVARLGSANTDMTVDGDKKGSMDNIVTALSGEFGWRFDLSKSMYVEPQVELAYTHVDADELSLSDGSVYRFDNANSLMGRAGFAFGLQCPENGNTAYLRVSAVHEFLGDNAVTGGNGKVYEIDGKDTWVEYGFGANFNLNDAAYVWADVERTSGSILDEDYRATIGVRHAF